MKNPGDLKKRAEQELTGNILPFWERNMPDDKHGGFHGRIDGHNKIIFNAPRGGILNARILWTFSAAYMRLGGSSLRAVADRSAAYILQHFFDREAGGTWWSLDHRSEPLGKKKQIYSQAYFIYALSEYYRATGITECLDEAIHLYRLIEKYAYDKEHGGYFEAFGPDWKETDDLRLSARDANEKKSMNSHLHILEAYSNLYTVWPDESLRKKIVSLSGLFTDTITDSASGHLNLFFDEGWKLKSDIISYGHDIEASWLLCEAADVVDDSELYETLRPVTLRLVHAALEGLQADGSLAYEYHPSRGFVDMDRHWWVQAEAVVGLLNAWKLTGEEMYIKMAARCFDYIRDHLVDKVNGEWYWSVRADGIVNRDDDKAGFWKCPYHNGRMCLEVLKRL